MAAVSRRILVIHEEIEMQVYLSTLLESGGFSAIMAGGSNEGMQIALREKPDLIIIEGIMAHGGGGRLYGHLKSDASIKDIPVIVISNLARECFIYYQKIHASSPGVVIAEPEAYLPKPPEREELLDVVSKLVRADNKHAAGDAGQIEETADAS